MCMFNIGAAMCLANAVRMSQENVRRAAEMANKHHDPDSYVDHDTYDEDKYEDYEEDGDPGDLDSFAEEIYENEYFAGDGEVPMPLDWGDAFDEWYEQADQLNKVHELISGR